MTDTGRDVGEQIGGYEIVGNLGAGGSSKVYRVVDADGRLGALKLLTDPKDEAAVTRLRREVKALQQMDHPAIPAVLDAEFDGDDKFVVYEFVDGKTLTDFLHEYGPLSEIELANFAETLANALHTVHSMGVVHRDVTPANVMMTEGGPVLIDFGLAQELGDDRLTNVGLVTGTRGYVPPEVIDGDEPDAIADMWSWAAVVAFAASGQSVFGHGKGAIRRTMEGKAELPSIVGADMLARALSPVRERRPDSSMVIDALRGDEPDEYEMYAPGPRPARRKRDQVDPAADSLEAALFGSEGGDWDMPETPRKGGVVAAFAFAAIAAALIAPLVAAGAATLLAALGRTEHRRVAHVSLRRQRRGRESRSDAAVSTVAWPWHLLRGTVELLPSLLVAIGVSFLLWWGLWFLVDAEVLRLGAGSVGEFYGRAVALVVSAGVFVFLLWAGPWTDRTRDGLLRGAALIAPTRGMSVGWAIAALLGMGVVAIAVWFQADPWWWPVPESVVVGD